MIQQSLPFPELEVIKERNHVTPADIAVDRDLFNKGERFGPNLIHGDGV